MCGWESNDERCGVFTITREDVGVRTFSTAARQEAMSTLYAGVDRGGAFISRDG
jgi:hypothetical protein